MNTMSSQSGAKAPVRSSVNQVKAGRLHCGHLPKRSVARPTHASATVCSGAALHRSHLRICLLGNLASCMQLRLMFSVITILLSSVNFDRPEIPQLGDHCCSPAGTRSDCKPPPDGLQYRKKGLAPLLSTTGRFQLESFCSGIPDLLARLETSVPEILLLDLTPEVTFGVLSDIKRVVRECKLVLWVNSISTEMAFQAMGLGVRGILRKTLPAELQLKCLYKVTEGELWFEKALTDSFLAPSGSCSASAKDNSSRCSRTA